MNWQMKESLETQMAIERVGWESLPINQKKQNLEIKAKILLWY